MLINIYIEKSVFPSALTLAEITPLYKKGDIYDDGNYFNPLLSDHMSGFRKGHGCQSVATIFVKTCKAKLDSKIFVGTILTDLSKAFDCIPCCLLISTLSMYGVHHNSYQHLISYFSNRRQRVKVWDKMSDLAMITKGSPQSSVMRSFMCNIFTNSLLLMMERCRIVPFLTSTQMAMLSLLFMVPL